MFVDSHCHLSFPELAGDLAGILERMKAAQVEAALNVCTTLEEFPRVLAIARSAGNLVASVGVHPDTTGAPEPTAFDEKEAGHVAVVFVNRQRRAHVRAERVAHWTWEEHTVTTLGGLRPLPLLAVLA